MVGHLQGSVTFANPKIGTSARQPTKADQSFGIRDLVTHDAA